MLPVNGQIVTLHGRVDSVSTSDGTTGTFVLNVSGRLYTCDVSSSTTWPNSIATNIGALRPDMIATVQGSMRADNTFTANSVTAQVDK